MDISMNGYSDAELLEALQSPTREVTYEYIVAKQNNKNIGKIGITDGVISFDSKQQVMRTFSGTVRKKDIIDLESVDYRLKPYMCLRIKDEVIKWPLGVFLINPGYYGNKFTDIIRVQGYDLGKIALDDKITSRFYTAQGGIYTSYIAQLLGECYTNVDIPASEKYKSYDQEWESGTSRISIANTMLNAISYTPLYFDEKGIALSREYVLPQLRSIERAYETRENSVFLDEVNEESTAFNVPNKFVRYTENVDASYMIATYVNDNPDDRYSTVNRGRQIVDSKSVNDIASQDDLNNCVQKEAVESMQATKTMTFNTLNMPGHGFQNCLSVTCKPYGINGKFIETAWSMELYTGGKMMHKCERVVEI